MAKNAGARLADIDPPSHEDSEKTIADLKARITKTIALLKTLDTGKIDRSAEREITFPLGSKKGHMTGADYLNHFTVPNFHFHVGAIPMRTT